MPRAEIFATLTLMPDLRAFTPLSHFISLYAMLTPLDITFIHLPLYHFDLLARDYSFAAPSFHFMLFD